MARSVEGPWFRASKGTWYATLHGKNVSLKVKGNENREEAVRAWHRLMADGMTAKPEPKAKPDEMTVQQLADAFLADAAHRLKAPTMRLYRVHLAAFCAATGTVRTDVLVPQHVAKWLHGLKHGSTTKAMMLRSVSACLGWGVANDMIPTNPAKQIPKPKSKSRSADAVITVADHEKMLALATPQFRAVMRVLHATGCRPGEACKITADNFDAQAGVVKLVEHKTDATGSLRLIFLTPDVCEVLKGLAERHPTGTLLRTRKGKPWNAQLINQQVRRLAKRVGIGSAMWSSPRKVDNV